MKHHQYYYLVHIQYLGFRFHGWAKQANLKTLHQTVDKTLEFTLKHSDFKTLGAGRTDAKVSANHTAFQLFTNQPIEEDQFLSDFNKNGPTDLKALSIEEVDDSFNIIQSPKIKEYMYLFSQGEKAHPFSASLLTSYIDQLDIPLMQKGAKLFEGKHNFKQYCTKPSQNTQFEREILKSEIELNSSYTANFFPEKSYAFHIHSTGFMRYQIRLIMGQLVELGKHNISLDFIQQSLLTPADKPLQKIAPASGLILNKIRFQ